MANAFSGLLPQTRSFPTWSIAGLCMPDHTTWQNISRRERHGVQLLPGSNSWLMILCYHLQAQLDFTKQLDNLYHASERLNLTMNTDEAKITPFIHWRVSDMLSKVRASVDVHLLALISLTHSYTQKGNVQQRVAASKYVTVFRPRDETMAPAPRTEVPRPS